MSSLCFPMSGRWVGTSTVSSCCAVEPKFSQVIHDVEVRDAGSKGCGVYAPRRFAEGEFIFRRKHIRVVSTDNSTRDEWDRMHLCELGFDRFAVLAAPGCFLNHSAAERYASRRQVFAWKPIERDEEITIDYRLNAFDGDSWPCECGAPSCTGTVVGSFFAMEPERQELLAPHAPTSSAARQPASHPLITAATRVARSSLHDTFHVFAGVTDRRLGLQFNESSIDVAGHHRCG